MTARSDSVLILIPSYNDWDALSLLLPQIHQALHNAGRTAAVLIVDDASSDPLPEFWPGRAFAAIESIDILHLRCNLGHQRAIALGLYHAYEFTAASAIVVMDADGEDRAAHIPILLAALGGSGKEAVVFAARTKRMESVLFQLCYRSYRILHWVLTGVEVRVGNFSVLSRAALTRLMAVSDLWNHYAAAVFRARIPRRLVPLPRGTRLAGQSRMNFVSLLIHGLAAISVFADQVSARLLAASATFAGLGLALMFWNGGSTAGWVLLALSSQTLAFAVLFALTIVSRRSAVNFLLLRDAPHFLLSTTTCAGAIPSLDRLARALEQETPQIRAGVSR